MESNSNNKKFPYRLSYKEKRRNDFEAARAMMDYYNGLSTITQERCRRFDENLNLHRGAWPEIENMAPVTNLTIQSENVTIGGGKLYHYPLINIVSQAIVSDIITNPMIPVIRDTSTKARNYRDMVRAERVRRYFKENLIDPKINAIKLSLQGQEVPKEIEAEIKQAVLQDLPEDILEGMEDYKMPDEQLAEVLYNHVMEHERVKYKMDMGADYAVSNAEEYYMIYTDATGPKIKVLNPKYVEWGGSDGVEMSHEGEWAKYTEYISFPDFIARFGTSVRFKDLDEILDLYSRIPSDATGGRMSEAIEREIDLDMLDTASRYIGGYPDPKTVEGQEKIKFFYRNLLSRQRAGEGIKTVYITWRWTRKGKLVEDVSGKLRIEDEHYVHNPARGDCKIHKVLLPQVWHGYIINDKYYAEIEPVPWQYENLLNPFNPKLTIYGIRYNTYMSNTRNSSFVDLGKPFNFRINVLMKKMQEYEATDIGKVLFFSSDIKPDKMTWGQWYSSLFQARVGRLNEKYEGMSVQQQPPVLSVDMSRAFDIKATIDKLTWLENKLIRAMHYNPAKFGDINQYATNTNIRLSITGVDRQLMRFIKKRGEMKVAVCTALLNAAISSYKDNDYLKNLLLDDYLRVHYDANVEPFAASHLALYLVDDFEEGEKLEAMRNTALAIIQNGGSARDIARIINARSMSEVENILLQSERRARKRREEERQYEAMMADKRAEIDMQQAKLHLDYKAMDRERDRQVKLKMAELNSSFMAKGMDVDRDSQSDSLEATLAKIRLEEKKHNDKMALERLKLESKR